MGKEARLERIIEYLSDYTGKPVFFQKAVNFTKEKGGYVWVGVYFLFNNELRRTAFSGKDDNIEVFKMGEGNPGFAAKNGMLRLVQDIKLDKKFIPRFREAKSEASMPIIEDRKVIGVIDCISDRVNGFSDDDILFLKRLADLCRLASRSALLV